MLVNIWRIEFRWSYLLNRPFILLSLQTKYFAHLPTFKTFNFQLSTFNFQLSTFNFQLSNFQTFKLSNFQTFKLSNFQTFKLSNFQTFKLSTFNPSHTTPESYALKASLAEYNLFLDILHVPFLLETTSIKILRPTSLHPKMLLEDYCRHSLVQVHL